MMHCSKLLHHLAQQSCCLHQLLLPSVLECSELPWPSQLVQHSSQHSSSFKATLHTATAAPQAADGPQQPIQAGSAAETRQARQGVSTNHEDSNSSVTEEQLATLFDDDLQQRLAAAARRAAQQQQGSDTTAAPPPAAANEVSSSNTAGHQHQDPATAASTAAAANSSSTSTWSPQHAARGAWQQQQQQQQQHAAPPILPGGWHPLLSADPWAPLPSQTAARQQLPQQLLQLLRQAGVSQGQAAAALQQACSIAISTVSDKHRVSSNGDSRSSSKSADANSTPSSSSRRSSSSGGTGVHRRWLFGGGDTQPHLHNQQQQQQQLEEPPPPQQHDERHHQQQQQQQREQQGFVWSVLSRVQTRQLVQLLDECQAPSYGDKQVLLRRLVLLLQEQQAHHSQQAADTAHHHHQQEVWDEPQQEQQTLQQQQRDQQREQEQLEELPSGPAAVMSGRQVPAVAAQQRLLAAVLDVRQVAGWLLEARAQDVCVIDVRGRAGQQTHLVVATGLNQRHARALAEAVAWQLQQAALAHLEQQQQDGDTRQAARSQDGEGGQPAPFQAVLAAAQQHQHQQDVSKMPPIATFNTSNSNQQQQQDPRALLPPLSVVGGASSEWCLLDVGPVAVHVLTERARRFYALEGLWGGARGQHITWLRPVAPRVETKDTIGRPSRAAG